MARITRKILYQEVANQLRGMIRARELGPGDRIDEANLAGVLGISRTPLREALKVLVSEGLLRMESGRGCFVNELATEDLENIFPLVALLEGRCAYEAALKARATDWVKLEPLHADLRHFAQAGDIDAYYRVNAQIHLAVQALAMNPWLSSVLDNLRGVLGLSRHHSLSWPGRVQESCSEHLAIFAALRAHDPDQAERLTRQHLMRQLEVLRIMIRQSGDASPAAGPVSLDTRSGVSSHV
jgi:DNA-binding GntR family transcriptional regulator